MYILHFLLISECNLHPISIRYRRLNLKIQHAFSALIHHNLTATLFQEFVSDVQGVRAETSQPNISSNSFTILASPFEYSILIK